MKTTAAVSDPLQTVCGAGTDITGIGNTLNVKLTGEPVQPFATDVALILAMAAVVALLIPINAGISPVPEADSPIPVKSFTHVISVFGTLLLKLID